MLMNMKKMLFNKSIFLNPILMLCIGLGMCFGFTIFARGFFYKEIELSKPKYLGRKGKLWEKEGRLVGEVKRPPETYTIEIRNAIQKTNATAKILTEKHNGYLSIYETAFMPPGKYQMIVKAEGFLDQKFEKLEIKAGADCVLNIIFGATVYEK